MISAAITFLCKELIRKNVGHAVHGRRIQLIQMKGLLAVVLPIAGRAAWFTPNALTSDQSVGTRQTSVDSPRSCPVIMNRPQDLLCVDLGVFDSDGQPLSTTCHATRLPNPPNRAGSIKHWRSSLTISLYQQKLIEISVEIRSEKTTTDCRNCVCPRWSVPSPQR
jgi:hypothetical protein